MDDHIGFANDAEVSAHVRAGDDGVAVLFVDDEMDNRLVLMATFRGRFRCQAVESAQAALVVLAREPIAVLVTDQRMPGLSGVDLCEVVRGSWPAVRRVMLSADATRTAALEAMNRGQIHAFVDKPWSESALEATIRVGLAEVAAERAADALRLSLEARARLEATEAAHRALLHDLASATGMADLSFDALAEWVEDVAGRLPTDEVEQAQALLAGLRHGLDFAGTLLRQLRRRPDGLERQPETLHVAELVDVAVRVAAYDQRIQVQLDVDSAIQIHADRVAVCRILINLVQNAAQAMRRSNVGQTIVIVASRLPAQPGTPAMTRIVVQDDGPGIEPHRRDRVFELGVSTRPGSDGEGLPLARSLAAAEGGELALLASSSARGTAFRLTLPTAAAGASAGSSPPATTHG